MRVALPFRALLVLLVAAGLVLGAFSVPASAGWPGQDDAKKEKKDKKKEKDAGEEKPLEAKDVNREVSRMLREMQFALEGGSSRSFLALLDSAKFDDYPRFEDSVERLMREDTIRANFRQVMISPNLAEGKAQTMVDAEMELGRKDAAGQLQRRKQQLVLDFERTRRGWRIINITPRNYFEPL